MARPRAADFEEKQAHILDSAAAVFAELGMDKASMSQIARECGVSKALLYHYYPSKDALIFAIIDTHVSHLDDAVIAADDPDLPPGERLERLVRAVLETYRGADNAHKVQLNAFGVLSEAQRAQLRDTEKRIVARFSSVLKELNPQLGEPGTHLLTPVTMSLFGMLNWVYTWFKEDGPITREDYARVATKIILDGVGGVNGRH
ncbi:TetR/AcrR family transcriptional regulator [Roseitalea porphyridii]|uniref:TetR/AcrR family transcriptional regulator n=1 Tax=Roseitalea porphyridii TaxID=1852022 RepID=A0A4P6V172_9HYPH|nr:TetR/AcrR family transcriptional regulator [Roseitalea porphyridii]QBK31092.1 TetR/AcrR family transcriptional regulator [Roseitalea porphyridii]